MEEWFVIQSFYHKLIRIAREYIDASAGGSFFALSIEEAHKLIEKMACNQSYDDERTPSHTRELGKWLVVRARTCSLPRLIFL
jgi:hypothetical protein